MTARYWLVPVTRLTPLTLGEERIRLDQTAAERLIRIARGAHPRLILPMKITHIIQQEQDTCGRLPQRLEADGPIVLNEKPWSPSGCACRWAESLLEGDAALVLARHFDGHALGTILVRWWSQGFRSGLLVEPEGKRVSENRCS
ncbi:hypothetical protein NWF35_13725 [Polycladomyces subterraneus]|uniref:Uncharacterized protein n=1 Tax=Polycladomyces subterraneus TaxID=1016997 RepID=A0ABT8IQB2_9BACL|nr:hypothetical protein [Polycladomyces subterraneus]MDN4594925.1 hypothetical protein [Polycladomyces subterraneus]